LSRLSASIDDLKNNDRQWEAFTTEGHCVVLAPPGSGKTKLLTTRMAYDLANKIRKPQGAACVTLTNAAAEELRRRVDEIGVEDRPNLVIGTVHSFLLRKVVEPFAHVVGRPELASITIASAEESDKLLREAVTEAFPYGDTWLVQSTIRKLRQRIASDEDWAKAGDGVIRAAQLYDAKLAERRLHDFSGLVITAVDLVENHHVVRQTLNAQFPRLYVDEYQDLAPGLDRVVKALCFDHHPNSELFAVGDPDQALFAFTGTLPELLNELAVRHDVRAVELTRNYRCGAEIITVANRMRGDRPPIVGDRAGGEVSVVGSPLGLRDQYARVIAAARKAHASGVDLHEIAVLCPTRPICAEVTAAIREAGIPVFYRDSKREYSATSVPLFIEAAAAWAGAGRGESGYQLGDLLRQWRYLLGPLWTFQHDRNLVAMLISWADRRSEPATTFLADLGALGLAKALRQVALAAEAPEVKRMEVVMRLLSLGEFATRALPRGRVEVTTTTSCKGLEFDVVFVVGADEELMPSYQSKTQEDLAEDRRRFYVSITRARNELRIFCSGFVITKYDRRINAGVSRFVKEIGLA
jgi:DNA helicase-2/ATP-dependent DNA helicase PcrA